MDGVTLDLNRLLGFKIGAKDADGDTSRCTAVIGAKVGNKGFAPATVMSAKIGSKIGTKGNN